MTSWPSSARFGDGALQVLAVRGKCKRNLAGQIPAGPTRELAVEAQAAEKNGNLGLPGAEHGPVDGSGIDVEGPPAVAADLRQRTVGAIFGESFRRRGLKPTLDRRNRRRRPEIGRFDPEVNNRFAETRIVLAAKPEGRTGDGQRHSQRRGGQRRRLRGPQPIQRASELQRPA